MNDWKLFAASCLVLAVGSSVGCTSGRGPFAAKIEPAPPGIRSPYERTQELKALAASAATRSEAEMELVAAGLAKDIQTEQDPLLREQIVRTLSVHKAPSARAVLHAALKDEDLDVRVTACEAWTKQPPALAVDELAAVLAEETEIDVRMAAARALGQLKHPAAMAPLAEALADPNPALQNRVAASLRGISGRDFGSDPVAWQRYATTGEGQEPTISLAERFRRLF